MEQINTVLMQLQRLLSVGNVNAARELWQQIKSEPDAQSIYNLILSEYGIALD